MSTPTYYGKSEERFVTLLLSDSPNRSLAMQEAARATPKATATILFEGKDAATVRAAGEAYAQFAQQINAFHPKQRVKEDPEINRRKAERALRAGGALLSLVIEGRRAKATRFFRELDKLAGYNR